MLFQTKDDPLIYSNIVWHSAAKQSVRKAGTIRFLLLLFTQVHYVTKRPVHTLYTVRCNEQV